ncbi:low molecular weight protein-tyrosine-phosphatase [Brachybacterium saurashtrense]|uniref:protein-tyrosine-phosphatase n=1 Tax=Brachybacterium saurashtrense TaxID=556288 RepID=A0A345YLI5_9MICO|nr:low molecular weight protein-tyrosine-phosphatase [Brachybacterium saurashtrense]AXK44787.1 low molecular weight phosphotyrosine protein phosphatase [Brachybacterium saurashtrense]RRR23399.1 low molecular weight phosphotyrosine protein phosphatase [Brachybacterium saurashtrense]
MTYRILTVCTGNICRSPMAEYVLRAALEDAGLGDRAEVSSVGTTGWEEGNPIDPRAGALLARHGIASADHRARRMEARELRAAHLVLTLDHDHVDPVRRMLGPEQAARTQRMVRDFAPGPVEDTGIRDPWYGDEDDFETVWTQLDEAVDGIVTHVREALAAQSGADSAEQSR